MNIQDIAQLASVGYFIFTGLLAIAIAIVIYGDKMSRKRRKS